MGLQKGMVRIMRRYGQIQGGELEEVVCNGCGKALQLENGYLKEGCFFAECSFGYFSRKDGIKHRFDLCEDCYDKMIAQFQVPVNEEQERELC